MNNGQLTFDNYHPKSTSFKAAVIEGLAQPQKAIPPKFFYDDRGSALFEAICEQPEYYLPSVERGLLQSIAPQLRQLVGEQRVLIEPGAGSASKIKLLLDSLQPAAYVPMDIACEFLQWASNDLLGAFPWLDVHAACVDFTHSMPIPQQVPEESRLVFFPGSSLGNFEPDEALQFLSLIRQVVGEGGMLLIGVDTKKSPDILNAAYNDAAGVTAEFNLNLLHRMRRELGADCQPERFRHRAFYNEQAGRIEMHLLSPAPQSVRVGEHRFDFEADETVHTESSYKYSVDEFLQLAGRAGFSHERHWTDPDQLFAVYLLSA